MIWSEPPWNTEGVKSTEQLEVLVEPTWTSVQLAPGFEKPPTPVEVNAAEPAGKDLPPESVSETVTEHVVV